MKKKDDVSKLPADDSISSSSGKDEIEEVQSSQHEQISSDTLGVRFAKVFLSELRLEDLPEPSPHDKVRWIKELHDKIPKRGNITSFRKVEGQDAPKFAFSASIASEPTDPACKRLFCIFHSEFVPAGCMASEHVYPYAKVRINQKRLLDFLNASKDKEIIDDFLGYENIDEYLRRDGNQIKGSTYFYKQCYNIMDNLFLMCQGCNSSKGDTDPLKWFEKEKTYFGAPFIKHVDELGGLHEGILLPRVYKKKNFPLEIPFSEEEAITLPDDGVKSQGLGIVVQEWFFQYYRDIFEAHRTFYTTQFDPLNDCLKDLASFLVSGNIEEYQKAMKRISALRKDMKELAAIEQKIITRIQSGERSFSSSESREFDLVSEEELPNFHTSRKLARHATHKIDDLIKVIFLNNFQISFEGNTNPIYQYTKELRFREPSLPGKSWQNIFEEFSSYIENFNFNTFNLKEEGAKEELENLLKSKLSELYDKELRKLNLVSVQEVEQKLAEKDKEVEKLKRENAELKRKVERHQKSSSHSEQPSPSSESHSFTPFLHSKKPPPLSSSSSTTSFAGIEMADELERESESKRESDLKRKQREGESNFPPEKRAPK